MENKKYTWNFDEDAELWQNDDFSTVEECIEDANYYADEENLENGNVYVGEVIPFKLSVDAKSVLDKLQEDVFEFAGEASESWELYDYKKKNELEELSRALTDTVNAWLKKYKREPVFYSIQNIEAYPINKEQGNGQAGI